ncbi:Pertussis toxin, subunit 1 [Streptomyces sp. yr375]|uniref:hypothetical protein n=1 Tax=Streptomyces sp. yr375 TaxID=1761906 RepID=UPI0008ABDDA9|nr:hypothetical protein [Streptomyces sp. yr375]SES50045.1 Pertussis toxin, subunit 1 [Streptomyces sp. yr375]
MLKRTAVYVRGKTRSRRGKTAFAALFAIVIAALFAPILTVTPAQAVTITDCPGGTYSGQGGGNCPNLRNKNLNNQRAMPNYVYRGDSRDPYGIFQNGMLPRGHNNDVVAHVQGDRAGNSQYISTSGTQSLAETFARSQGMRNLDSAVRMPGCTTGRMRFYSAIPFVGPLLLKSCIDDRVQAYTFVYVIDTKVGKNAMYIADQIRGNKALYNQYKSQDEWAYVGKIKREAIAGVRIYKMTARVERGGTLDLRTLTFSYDKFFANKYHQDVLTTMANYHPYDPVNDPFAQWNYYSDLHTPPVPPTDFNRDCISVNRCRGANQASSSGSGSSSTAVATLSVASLLLGKGKSKP